MRFGRLDRDFYTLPVLLLIIVPLFYYLTSPADVLDAAPKRRTSAHREKSRQSQAAYIKEENQEVPEVPLAKKPDSDFLLKSDLKDATVITRSKTGWSRDEEGCKDDDIFLYTELNSPAGLTPIYVHPFNNKLSGVSSAVITGSVWEEDIVAKLYNLLKESPDMQFIDIGANIGGYGLTMAKLGRKVLMIEPLLTNVRKLCLSVREGNFHDAYVLHNALSSKQRTVRFVTPENGLSEKAYISNVTSHDGESAYAILLDDLLEAFKFTTVTIKLDVVRHEAQVLKGADNFFNKVNVRYVLVEWGKDKIDGNTGADIIKFLSRHNMAPYDPVMDILLAPHRYYRWLRPVLWKKTV